MAKNTRNSKKFFFRHQNSTENWNNENFIGDMLQGYMIIN